MESSVVQNPVPVDDDLTQQVVVGVSDYHVPGDKPGRWKGHGNAEVLDVVNILRELEITSCVVGVGALKYFGAHRVLHNWEICVSTENFSKAVSLLKNSPYDQIYELCPPVEEYLRSMLHTFPLFKPKGIDVRFHIIPSDDCHIECTGSNIEYSNNGLPYPKLPIFAESLLASHSIVDLTDLIDGMDLDETWGRQNLDLSATNDVAWAHQKNEKIVASSSDPLTAWAIIPTYEISCAETWNEIVKTKERRIGEEVPKEYFSTRFRAKAWGDPRMEDRSFV